MCWDTVYASLRSRVRRTLTAFILGHRGHVGVQNNSEKSLLGISFYCYAKLEGHLPLFCTPTWPSHHVSENKELFIFLLQKMV